MTEEPLPRKLAAILYADVAGYSRLPGADEEGTHRTLSAYLDAISTAIENHNGKVLHYAGDAVLAEFTSVVSALTCALAIQYDINTRNKNLLEDRKLQFRMGVNIGDVIVDRGEIYGEGVNVAARLESLAEPGGICISDMVRQGIEGKLDLDLEDLGEKQFKNIDNPVRAYRVALKAGTVLSVSGSSKQSRRLVGRSVAATGAILFLLIGAAAIVWQAPWEPVSAPIPREQKVLPIPDNPSIAVLPFSNVSSDEEQDYFTDGMTDDLITDLSGIPGLLVIARNSVFVYKNKPVNVQQVAKELGVRYVLEGSVRRSGDRLRINAQLIDATTGGHLWAERYDESIVDVFSLQDKVTRRIAAALKVELAPQKPVVSTGRDTKNVAAYDTFLEGWAYLLKGTANDAVQATKYFQKALELDPNYSGAYAATSQTYWDYSGSEKFNSIVDPPMGASFAPSGHQTYINAWKYLQKAHRKPSSQTHTLAARMLQRQRRFSEALEEAKQAVALGPNNAVAYDALIENLIYAGKVDEALKLIDKSIRIDPNKPGEKLFLQGMAYYTLGQSQQAVAVIEKARRHNPRKSRYAGIQAAALAELDQMGDAGVALRDYLGPLPNYADLNWAMFYWPFQQSVSIERLAHSLVKAGLATPSRRYFAVAAEDRLTTDQIKSLVSGKTMIGINQGHFGVVDRTSTGVPSEEFKLTRDINAKIVRQGKLNYFRTGGEIRIENDLLCDYWQDFLQVYCVAIFRNPDGAPETRDEYIFFTLMNTFSFSVFDTPKSD